MSADQNHITFLIKLFYESLIRKKGLSHFKHPDVLLVFAAINEGFGRNR